MAEASSSTPKLPGVQEKRNKPQALAFWQSRTRKDSSSSMPPTDAERPAVVSRGRGSTASSLSRISAAIKQGASSSSSSLAKRDPSASSSTSKRATSAKRDASVSSSVRERAGSASTTATSGSAPVLIDDEDEHAADGSQDSAAARLRRRGRGPKIVGLDEEVEQRERRSLEDKQKAIHAQEVGDGENQHGSQGEGRGNRDATMSDFPSRLGLALGHDSLYPDLASSSGASSSSKRSSRTSDMLSKSSSSRGNSPWNQQAEWTAGDSSTSGQSAGPEADGAATTHNSHQGYLQTLQGLADNEVLSGLGISDMSSMGIETDAGQPSSRQPQLRRRAKSLSRPRLPPAHHDDGSDGAARSEARSGQDEGLSKDHARSRRRRKLLRNQMKKRQARRRGNTISTSRAEAEIGSLAWGSDGENDGEEDEKSGEDGVDGWGSDELDGMNAGASSSAKVSDRSSMTTAREGASSRQSLGAQSASSTGRRVSMDLATYGSPPESMRSFSALSHDGSEAFYDAGAGSSPESHAVPDTVASGQGRNRNSRHSSSIDGSSWLHLVPRQSATASSATLRQDAIDRERRLENKESSATLSPRDSISASQSPAPDAVIRGSGPSTHADGLAAAGSIKREMASATSLPPLASPSNSSPQEPELASPSIVNFFDGSFVPDMSSPSTSPRIVSRPKRNPTVPPARPMPHSPPPPPPQPSSAPPFSVSGKGARQIRELSDRGLSMERSKSSRVGKMRDHESSSTSPTSEMARTESDNAHQRTSSTSGSSLGPSGTIRGRPRGATVGAVPGILEGPKLSQQIPLPLQRARPRSMLCNEMVLSSTSPPNALASGHAANDDSKDDDDLVPADFMSSTGDYISPADAILSSMMREGDEDGLGAWSQAMYTSWSADSSSGYRSGARSVRINDSVMTSPRSLSNSSSRGSILGTSVSNISTSSTGAASTQAQVGDTTLSSAGANGGTGNTNGGSSGGGSAGAGGSNTSAGSGVGSGSGGGNRSRSGSNASLLQQMQYPPKSSACFVIGVVGHRGAGKSTVIKKGLRQYGLFKSNSFSEKVKSHSTMCVVDQEQRSIEVIEIDASLLLNGPNKRFAWPKFLPRLDAVCLCYDAAQLSSFRGISELLENFSVHSLSTVMLACKSDIEPKAVDPWYASDMAGVYNVGLAECSVNTEEGKRRMRDCFSYLVKDVVKVRARKGLAFDGSLPSSSTSSQRSGAASLTSTSTPGATSATSTDDVKSSKVSTAETSRAGLDETEALSSSLASSMSDGAATQSSPAVAADSGSLGGAGSSGLGRDGFNGGGLGERSRVNRKLSDATTASVASVDAPSAVGSASEDDKHIVQQSISRAQMGLQSAKSAGGYVSIEELWDKLFFAAVSGEEHKFLFMFMIFYRGFARPSDLLRQLVSRFGKLAEGERHDGTIIRFSMMRLITMLADWMRDYPGDLSGPETFPMLKSFFDDFLLVNESSRHLAVQLEPLLDVVQSAPDLDAVWSKNQDNHKPQSVAADVPPVKPVPMLESSDASLAHVDRDRIVLSAPSSAPSSAHHVDSATQDGTTSNAGSDTRSRAYSDTSSAKEAASGGFDGNLLQARPAGFETRHRSASDVTAASSEDQGSSTSGGISASANTSASNSLVDESSVRARSGSGTNENFYDASASSQVSPAASSTRLGSVASVGGAGSGAGAGAGSSGSAGTNVAGTASSSTTGKADSTSSSMIASATLGDQKTRLRAASNALFEVDDELVAQELTRLEWILFTAIRPRDLLRHILVDRHMREKEAPVARSIAHFNYVSFWVCSMILVQAKLKPRARMLEKFMNIAVILRHENNYNSLQAVLAGLGNAAVHRLKHTRELLNGKPVNKAYQSLARLMGSDRSFAAYRLALQNSEGQTIPYLGVHLQDILSISDGNPSKRASDAMVHWRKFSLMDDAVGAIVKCQEYDFQPAASGTSTTASTNKKATTKVDRLVEDLPVWDEEALYSRSLQVEPRQGSGPSAVGALANSRIIRSFFAD